VSGKELMEAGLLITAPDHPSAPVITYRKIP
jgi:hypothetical protein